MTPASTAIKRALERFAGVHAAMATALERGQPVRRESLQEWSRRLKEAAAEIEQALK